MEPLTPDALREALFNAVDEGDLDHLSALCESHEQAICDAFPGWRTVPEPFRAGPRLRWYIQGLTSVAQHMAALRGRPELFAALTTVPDDTQELLKRLEQALADVDAFAAQGRYEDAELAARAALLEGKGHKGGHQAMLTGRLGECLFHTGRVEGARAPFEETLALCEESGDDQGSLAALFSLFEVHRYLGETAEAAARAERIADILERLGDADEARAFRRRAARVRAGEPRCRVVAIVNDRPVELDELAGLQGSVQFIYERNRPELRVSSIATEEGERLGAAREFVRALEAFRRGAAADRHNPSPVYQAGVTCLFMGRPAEAAELFRKTEELAPGWFRCRAYRFLAERIAAGAVDPEVFALLSELDRPDLDPTEKARRAEQALAKADLGLLHLALGDALAAQRKNLEARAAYRRGLDIAEEPDVRTQLLVKLGNLVDDPAERVRLYRDAVALGGNLLFAAVARLSLASLPSA
ncbi:tetratricopeptide repeat protein [Polyangium spumosum]|uniref:Tetratricopeptide repeat protein n=1 Tax=Polyangium spumosum TaxID=889282 RepID=A0A6N7PGU3_9BACT|nr:tetratricopeptide repeat protein [Polyangium spumosum]MRG91007.1 tetratricopeptide repeat protein [Polyangium spumosum]